MAAGCRKVAVVLAGMALGAAWATESTTITPGQLKFTDSPRAPGVLTAPLHGVPSKPEYYVFRARYPARTVNRPHSHPGDEELTVISGTLYFGTGTEMSPDGAPAYPPGSYLRVPAGAVHYLYTKDEPAELEIRGMGPRQNVFVK